MASCEMLSLGLHSEWGIEKETLFCWCLYEITRSTQGEFCISHSSS